MPEIPFAGRRLTRRGFLAGLGALAGAGALSPLLARGARDGAAGGRRMRRLEASRPLFGTWVRVVVRDEDPARAARGLEDAFLALHGVDATMSIHRPDSQVSRVNAAAGRRAVPVDAAVLDVVARACRVAERAAGVYDPTVLPLMHAFGFYGAAPARYPGAPVLDAARARVDWRQVRIDRAAGTLGLAREGSGLDLGSIGKGWGVDVAVAALRARGVRHGLVDVGGNVYGLGTPDDDSDGWSVGVFHPVSGGLERVFVLRDAAVATSGNREQSRVLGGVRVGHLLDARRGRPADGPLAASVVAATGTDSDTMSTVAFLLGPDRLGAFAEIRDAHFVG
jgi:thiamine biosynthesis lipoprotein